MAKRKQITGLGDAVEAVTEATGIKAIVHAIAGDDCGCDERKKKWNELFPFQKKVAEFSLEKGRSALFLDTGLGKTITQCEWARHIPGEVLIVAPLAVASQTVKEAQNRLGMEVTYSKDGTTSSRVTITNYERLDKFDCRRFAGVVLDESSILKGFMGKTGLKENWFFILAGVLIGMMAVTFVFMGLGVNFGTVFAR